MNELDDFTFDNDGETTLAVSRKPARQEDDNEGQLTVDVFENNGDIIVKSTIAGVGADDLDISLTKDMVTIRGTRRLEDKVSTKDFYHRELYWGSFSRSIILPEDIDTEKARATMKNGLLTLILPKLSKNRTKKLKISA